MRKNKHNDMTPIIMKNPKRQNTLFLPLVWVASRIMLGRNRFKINREEVKGLKPPYLVLSMHQGFSDYAISPLALFPYRASYVSDMEGFANYGEWLYSQIGCIPTRRFINDLTLVKNIQYIMNHNKDIVVVFPESRHSNVGTNSELPKSTGKLIKLLKYPVVIQKLHGSYLASPIWDEEHIRRVPLETKLEVILTPEKIEKLSTNELNELVNSHFSYDEYKWQYENKIQIDYQNRACGLHKMLYLCPSCKQEYRMDSIGTELFCNACNKRWEMDVYGRISAKDGETEFNHIPDWYNYEREQLEASLDYENYHVTAPVRIEALPNAKGFIHMGEGVLEHTVKGYTLTFYKTGEVLFFSSKALQSLHTECNYKGNGDCIVLSTNHCCYYIYPTVGQLEVTKLLFATESFYKKAQLCRGGNGKRI